MVDDEAVSIAQSSMTSGLGVMAMLESTYVNLQLVALHGVVNGGNDRGRVVVP